MVKLETDGQSSSWWSLGSRLRRHNRWLTGSISYRLSFLCSFCCGWQHSLLALLVSFDLTVSADLAHCWAISYTLPAADLPQNSNLIARQSLSGQCCFLPTLAAHYCSCWFRCFWFSWWWCSFLWLFLLGPLRRPYRCSIYCQGKARAGRLNCFTSHFSLTGISNSSQITASSDFCLLFCKSIRQNGSSLGWELSKWIANVHLHQQQRGTRYCHIVCSQRWDEKELVLNATDRNWRQFRCTIALMSCGTSFLQSAIATTSTRHCFCTSVMCHFIVLLPCHQSDFHALFLTLSFFSFHERNGLSIWFVCLQ